ncbi:MAG: hypothetical protein GFH27_549279n318 [Chloroflexi bacterium AL-W]|nr:hypothetical protein [Chloroflexi bacterium AL-N1]NOK65284.1 hypothetical protein [Chloroflexi bacterium AL-N10]NOK72451.1 hypothetical protein [Chloroflexi bacterium AL-N5]NOK79463.1 hypothetical protein [Chloroflexi bacterium AL-W]NOK87379.1 hypothetical protein [Chloroflexi bacterium AL-N15]
MKTRLTLVMSLVVLMIAGLVLVPFSTSAQMDDGESKVRVVHASPDAPAVDVYVDGAEVLSDVEFFTASDYLTVPAGDRLVQVTAADQPLETAVISAELSLEGDMAYTVAATGTLLDEEDDAEFGPSVFVDDLSAPEEGEAKVRVYHFSPDAPNVDVLNGEAALIEDLAFPEASDTLAVPADTYDLAVTATGTTEPVVIDLADTELMAGNIYSVFAVDELAEIRAELDVETPTVDPDPTVDNAKVRVVHASPDAPAVDVYVDGDEVLSDVEFFTASDYLTVPAGDRLVQITVADEDPADAVISEMLTLETGAAYTVAATGLVADIAATVIEDDLSLPKFGEAKVRVYHFSPDAPAVDVLAGESALISNLAFPEASEYLSVPEGTYDLSVTPTGDPDTVVIDLPQTELMAGKIYSVFAVNTLENITAEVAVNEFAQVRVVHASPDAPNVDVYVDGVQVLMDVPFKTVSGYLQLAAGERLIQVTVTGDSPEDAVIEETLDLMSETAYTVAATGTLDGDDAADFGPTVIVDDLTAPAPGNAKVRVYHFSPDAPAVDVLAIGLEEPLISDLEFPTESEYIEVPATATYDLVVTAAGTTEPVVIDLADTTLGVGQIYSVFAVGFLTPPEEMSIQQGDDTAITAVLAATEPINPLSIVSLPLVAR